MILLFLPRPSSLISRPLPALVLLKTENKNLTLAARNIPSVKVLRMDNINVYDVIKYHYLITTQDALNAMQEVYGK